MVSSNKKAKFFPIVILQGSMHLSEQLLQETA